MKVDRKRETGRKGGKGKVESIGTKLQWLCIKDKRYQAQGTNLNVKKDLCQNTKPNETLVGATLHRKVCEDKSAIIVALGAKKISTNCLNNSFEFCFKIKMAFRINRHYKRHWWCASQEKMRSQNQGLWQNKCCTLRRETILLLFYSNIKNDFSTVLTLPLWSEIVLNSDLIEELVWRGSITLSIHSNWTKWRQRGESESWKRRDSESYSPRWFDGRSTERRTLFALISPFNTLDQGDEPRTPIL